MPYLFLLFIIMPIVEIAVLIKVGGAIGAWTTIGIVILTAVVGTYMLRQQGMATLTKAQQRLQGGEMPAQQLLEGLLLVIGGVLLLTPGFITDFFGFCTLFPVSRAFLAKQLASRSMGNMHVFVGGASGGAQGNAPRGSSGGTTGAPLGGAPTGQQSSTPNQKTGAKDPNIIDGDYQRLD